MNGSPPRLDLAVERARRAVSVGCLLSIDSDAHYIRELDYVRWGISQARRAWVTPADVRQHAVARGPAGLDRREAGARVSAPRTIAAMDDRSARHDLALVAVTVVGLSRLLEPPVIWLVAAALLGAMLLGTLQVLTDEVHPSQAWFGVPIESVILPSVAAVACLGAIRLVPFGLWLVPALAITWLIVGRTLDARGEDQPDQRPADLGRPDVRCWSRSCWSRSWRSPGSPRWCPVVSPRPAAPSARATCSSLPRPTPSWPGCSATGRRRCG